MARGSLYSAAFLGTMAVLGMTGSSGRSRRAVCVLIAFAFRSVGMAVTTYMRSWVDFEYVTASTLPLFLFSATFYPLSSYGEWGWVVQLSPLYHGVASCGRQHRHARQLSDSSTSPCWSCSR